MKYFFSIATLFLFLASCDAIETFTESDDSAYDRGYHDGFAVGYNTTCKIRATLIDGDWSNDAYSDGYDYGYSDGAKECQSNNN